MAIGEASNWHVAFRSLTTVSLSTYLFTGGRALIVNTLSDKSDSFFGEPAYWPACTQQARSGLGFSVEKHLTAKLSLILGDLGRVLPTTLPSDLSKFAFEVLPTALAVEPLTSQRTAKT